MKKLKQASFALSGKTLKRSIGITILLLINISNGLAQVNLVPNPSFEEKNDCPQYFCELFKLKYWFNLSNDNCDADYFDTCSTVNPNWGAGVPLNRAGFQYPHTGSSYVGIGDNPTNPFYTVSERVSIKLIDSLKPNICYSVSFYVSLADTACWAYDDLGAYFTKDSLYWPTTPPPLHWPTETPQVINTKGNVIIDKIHWTKICGNFIAIGGEKYITVGPFRSYDSTTYLEVCPTFQGIYYFIDDVSVYPCSTPVYDANAGEDEVICIGDSFQIGSPPRTEYLYAWEKAQGINDTAVANPWVKPTATTTYCLHQKDFKFDETVDCVTVTVDDCDANTISVVNAFTPNNDGKNDYFSIKGTNISSVHLKIINRWGQQLYEGMGEDVKWDGRYEGNDVSPGVYYYIVEVIFKDGEVRNKAGAIHLIK